MWMLQNISARVEILEVGLCLDADRIFLIPWEKLLFGQLIFFQYHNTLIPQSLQVPFSVP